MGQDEEVFFREQGLESETMPKRFEDLANTTELIFCPECGRELVEDEGKPTCWVCGWRIE